MDEKGTVWVSAHPVPLPQTISEAARARYMEAMRAAIARSAPGAQSPFASLDAAVAATQAQLMRQNARVLNRDGTRAQEEVIGGVRVIKVTPRRVSPENGRRILINIHGGAFVFYRGSVVEASPVADAGSISVLAVDYRVAPANRFPAALDDVIAVYRAVLSSYRPQDVGIYGTSAGAQLTAAAVLRLKQLGLPMPGAVAIVSYGVGDSFSSNDGLDPILSTFGKGGPDLLALYAGGHDLADPLLTPINGDFLGAPPALLITGTRDMFLSGTALLHRALLRNRVDARLIVYEGMWHGFNADPNSDIDPAEAREASQAIADFFTRELGKSGEAAQ